MWYTIGRKHIWVDEKLTLEETIDFIIKKLVQPHEKINRSRFRQLVINQKTN